ncbi:hypothetical protein D3C81_1731460 [compost metagenome]
MLGGLAGAFDHPGALFGAAVEHAVEDHQAFQVLRVVQGEGPCHQTAHGEADHRGLPEAQVFQQLAQLLGVAQQPGARLGARTGAVAEHVVGDDLELRGQADHLAAPHFLVQAHAVDQHHGVALAGRQITGAGRCALSGKPNHGTLLHGPWDHLAWACSAASSSRSM